MNTIIITGASGSVGEAATFAMAHKGWHVIMACRNLDKGNAVRQRVIAGLSRKSGKSGDSGISGRIDLLPLELSSSASIHAFADRMQGQTINALFNNAGIMCRNYTTVTDAAYSSLPLGGVGGGSGVVERTFAVNYLGTALLTSLIIPLMPHGGNIVNMVSLTTRFAHLDLDWPTWDEHHFGQLSTYGASKLALLYHTIALARRHPELHVNVADPGIVNSNMITMHRWYDPLADIFFRPFIKTAEQGALPAVNALHSRDSLRYFVGRKSNPIASRFSRSSLVEPLWEQLSSMML